MTDAGTFTVDLAVYSGPFRALADLIMSRKVDVCDVPVAAVTDRFLALARESDGWTLEEATWFLSVSSVLLELKVGRLLPRQQEALEDDLLGGSADLAYARSVELRAFRAVVLHNGHLIEEGSRVFPRQAGPPKELAHLYPDVMERVTVELLQAAAPATLLPPPALDLSHVTPIRASVADAMRQVETRIGQLRSARFRDLVADCEQRIDVVVRFLALLELHREGKVDLQQAATFGEIEVRAREEVA